MAGKLIIISAPSGSGKSSVISQIIGDKDLKLEFSISATTRAPRGGEIDGKDYYFLSLDDFKKKIDAGEFAEYEEVYEGRFYGTLKSEINRINNKGKNVILDVDVKGGMNVRKMYGEQALSLFIMPPSIDVLRKRLTSRATDAQEEIERRVNKAAYELTFAEHFDRVIVNDVLEIAVEEARNLIKDFVNN